jgi:hypothetical protein
VHNVLAAQPLLHAALCLVPQPSCYTTGLGLQPWQYEDRVSSSNSVHFASQRQQAGLYYGSRCAGQQQQQQQQGLKWLARGMGGRQAWVVSVAAAADLCWDIALGLTGSS